MSYEYQRPKEVRAAKEFFPFEVGVHKAEIKNVTLDESSKGFPMFVLRVVGDGDASGFYNLTFGQEHTASLLNYLLASIEDNGVEIPQIDFDYNEETANFLKGKEVYIEVKERRYKGKTENKIAFFLNQDEFEGFDQEDDFDEE
ncbi:MAG TPA: type III secretion system protein PrgE [Lactovum miscens]|uniref:type III secretion system protein PrgE n=1 Tax=Lactovum miscens TaxID=190387 RepID=UPI002EDB5F0C